MEWPGTTAGAAVRLGSPISMYAWQAYRITLTAAVFSAGRTATDVDPPTGQIAA